MIGILCFVVCTVYLIIRRFFFPSLIPSLGKLRGSTRFYITLNILFFFLLSYSIISIYLRSDPYIRPLEYFISTSLMAVIVAYEILFLSPQKSHICFSLCKTIIIGLSLGYSQILIFPNVVGIDPLMHQWFTLKIIDSGHIPERAGYFKMPIMHLMIGITSLVTDLGYKIATMFSIGSLQVISDALFIFLLGKFLINTKVGLLSALMLELSNFHILYNVQIIPNTAATILILPILFMLLKIKRNKPFIGNIVAMFLMGTLILTHPLPSLYLTILFFTFLAGSEAYSRLFGEEKTFLSVTLTTSVLLSIGMFAYWTYISGYIVHLARLIEIGFHSGIVAIRYLTLSEIPFWEQIFMSIGMFLFYSISFIGCFYMVSKQFRTRNRFLMTIGGIVILCLTFFSLIAEKFIVLNRWYYFSQIILVTPLSLSLFLLTGISKHRLIKGVLMSLSVITLSFLLIMSPIANMDNRLFSPETGVRVAFTESELHAMNAISIIWNRTIGSDWYSIYFYDLQTNRESIIIDDSFYSRDFTDLQGVLLLIREEILSHSFKTGWDFHSLKYDLHVTLNNQNYSRIYNCGSASGYLKPN